LNEYEMKVAIKLRFAAPSAALASARRRRIEMALHRVPEFVRSHFGMNMEIDFDKPVKVDGGRR
jgi:hypothetical protein